MATAQRAICKTNNFDDNRGVLIDVPKVYNTSDLLTQPYLSRKSELSDFDYSLKYLKELRIPDPDLEDEGEISVVSDYAYSKAYKLFIDIQQYLGSAFPYCSSSLDSRGGIDLVWDNPEFNKRVWVEIPFSPDLQSSVFYRQGKDNKLINNLSVNQVYRLLVWLGNDTSINDHLI